MDVMHISIAAMPSLLALMSRTGKAIAPCLLTSIFTVLLGGEPHRAVVAWCVGMLIAAAAMRERLCAA
jgi:flagellar biosynthesis/type III secretory pathway ATPase